MAITVTTEPVTNVAIPRCHRSSPRCEMGYYTNRTGGVVVTP